MAIEPMHPVRAWTGRHVVAMICCVLAGAAFATWAITIPVLVAIGHVEALDAISRPALMFVGMFLGAAFALETGVARLTLKATPKGLRMLIHSERKQAGRP